MIVKAMGRTQLGGPGALQRHRRAHALTVLAIRTAFIAGVLILWQLAALEFPREKFIISSPLDIVVRFGEMGRSGELWRHTKVTVEEVAIGYAIGSVCGIATGFLFGRSRMLAEIFEPIIVGLYGIPRTALAPLFIIWLGIGIESKVGIVILMTFFLTFFNTYSGIKAVDRDLVNLARLMGASEWVIIRRVILPAISPAVMLGLKTSVPQAVIGATVGEFIVSTAGLGYLIRQAAGFFDAGGLYVGVVVLLALVLVANYLLDGLERHLLRWRPPAEEHRVELELTEAGTDSSTERLPSC